MDTHKEATFSLSETFSPITHTIERKVFTLFSQQQRLREDRGLPKRQLGIKGDGWMCVCVCLESACLYLCIKLGLVKRLADLKGAGERHFHDVHIRLSKEIWLAHLAHKSDCLALLLSSKSASEIASGFTG